LYECLKDPHPYVRKTAVIALLKVYHLNPKLISDKDIDCLYEMIKDKDPMVVMNTLNVLNEILRKEGGIAISSKMIIHLLNNIKVFICNYAIYIGFQWVGARYNIRLSIEV